MSQDRPSPTNRKTALETSRHFRREFVAAGASVGTVLLAGCAATTDSADNTDETDESGTSDDADETDDSETSDDTDETDESAHTGNFRLLVTDLPADIGDFERLDVSFDSARVFDGEDDSSDDSPDDAPDDEPDDTPDDAPDDAPDDESDDALDDDTDDTPDDADDAPDDAGDSDDGGEEDDGDSDAGADGPAQRERGFYILDLDGATVDLTQVVGDRAMPVFDGELSPGTYNKIELHVSDIEGIVDGEQAEVKVPSEKLQITKPFEVRSGGTVEFVFDINVVRRGQQLRYNLTPVISGSGVNGEDVDVEDVSEAPAD